MNSTQSAAHSHAHPQQPGAQHPGGAVPVPKMPIPKHLPEKAQQIPQPVATGGGVSAGRPTLGNGLGTAGGTMSQPVIQKNPTFTWEAEGEHVLSKKKLDELVRQICGGGQEGNYLTPDVEEVRDFHSLLDLTFFVRCISIFAPWPYLCPLTGDISPSLELQTISLIMS